MQYRYEATSAEGFIQQLASNYLPHGFWFYVVWLVAAGEGSRRRSTDKLTAKYGIVYFSASPRSTKSGGLMQTFTT